MVNDMAKKTQTEIIGAREVEKAIVHGIVKKVMFADNCPDFILKKIEKYGDKISMEKFDGDQKQLGTKVGKPFPVAVVGFTE